MKVDLKIADILTLPITIMAAISLASSIILFLPDNFVDMIFMLEFRNENGFLIGIVFVISTAILIVNLLYKITTILLLIKKSEISSKMQKEN